MTHTGAPHRPHRTRAAIAARFIATALVMGVMSISTVSVAPAAAPLGCPRPVVLVHDIAASSASMEPLRRTLTRAGECVVVADYGSTPLARRLDRAGGPRLGGLTSLEQSGAELARYLRSVTTRTPVTVVAHGAGALAAQYAIAHHGAGLRVGTLITVGPVWDGTAIGGIADIEQISRRLGLFDTVLRLERPVVDPICAGCRQLVTGSDFLIALRDRSFPAPGVRYVDIVSRTDGLVTTPAESTVPGADVDVLQSIDPRSIADHFRLPADKLVQMLVLAHLRR